MKTVYVYSAVPPNAKETIKEYGLLSGVEVAKNKEILKLARPTKQSREDFVKKVEATAASDRPYPVLGPSVLFTLPDESKITDKHFIKEWGLIPVRINLSKLVEDYPETIIWGAELLPIKAKEMKLSDEAFDRKIEQEYGLTWEEFLEARSHELTLANVRKYSKMQPKTLWSNYERQHIGKYYAANVPHAFIITPMGYIPYAYVEFMNPRENPYPYYVDCDDAFADLLKLFEPNVEVQKKFALELFDSLGEVLEDYDWTVVEETLEELVDIDLYLSLRTEEDYLRIIRQKIKQANTLDSLRRWAGIIWPALPLYFIAQDFKVVENVKFVHYIPLDRLVSVKEQGFYGRATVGKMTWTRLIEDSYIKENGYFFAYDKKMIESGTPTVVSEIGRIEGVASKAISFYMPADDEEQLIIPFKCVNQYEILPKDLPKEDLKRFDRRMAEMFPKFDPLDYDIDRERKNPRENSGVVPLPYSVIDEISSHIADSVNASLQSETVGEDLYFVYPISDLTYVDGSLIEDYLELVVHIYQVSHSNRDSIEDETGLVIELEPHEFLVTDVAGLDTGFLEDSDPVYILYLFLNTEVDPQFKFVDSQKLFHLLIHEWTHLQDKPFRKYYPQSTYKDYINQKHEVIAYAQQIINDVYIHRSEFDSQFRDSPNGIVDFLDAFSQEWNEIKGVLSRKNKNRILNYVYAELFMNPRENPYLGTQTLFHCSPTVIDKIDPSPTSGEFMGTLFFASDEPYSPGLCDYVYKLTMDYDQIIHIRNLEPTDDELQETIRMVDVYCGFDKLNADQAHDVLTKVYGKSLLVDYLGGEEYFYNRDDGYGCVGEFGWWLQGQQARVAKRMGYFGAESIDENGYVVMADMVGREYLLNDYMSVEDEDYDEWLARENPWNYERAYFRYGFWDMPFGENEIFHATVKYSDILKSGSLSPRAFRESKEETLGGRHDVSISFYGSIYHAMNTLLYLYRMWQLEHDFESIPFSEKEKEKVTNLRTHSNYNIREILRDIAAYYFETAKNPIVYSDSWVADAKKEDFALITILNPCKYMYMEYLGTRYGKGSNFPMLESPAFEELAKYVVYSSYFNINRRNSLPSGSSIRGLYHYLKDAITNSKTHFEYDFGLNYWTKEPLRDEALARAVFGERSYFAETDRFTIGKNLYQFENITIDLNPQSLPIENICEFYAGEQEFRLFREILVKNFKDVYMIEEIIEIATELNDGVEPLFWDFTKGESGNYDLSKQKMATWEEERKNPYLESENGKIVNPETNDIIWYHGSWFGKLDRLKAYNPRQYYDATYFSSSEKLATEFATGEMAWLGAYEEAPRMKRSGYLHFVKIDDVKLLDPDKVFSDKEQLLLTDEGVILVQTLSDLGIEDSEIETWLKKFRGGRFHAFSKSNAIFPSLIGAMEKLGYNGWFEREIVTPFYSKHEHINIALLHPDEDAKLVGGHIIKRTRKF